MKKLIIVLASFFLASGLSAVTVEELEKRVTALEESSNKIIENIKKTNELVNKLADGLYKAEEKNEQDDDKDEDEDRSSRSRKRSRR